MPRLVLTGDQDEFMRPANTWYYKSAEIGTYAKTPDLTYTTCVSAGQKPLNLYYSFDEIPEVAQLYPTMELFYVDFRGSPSFINSGELTFDAIGGETTVVYSFQDEVLSPMISVYNKDSNTVTVRGVKRLDTYVEAAESVEGHEAVYSSSNAVPVKIPNAVRVETESNPSTG